MLSYLKQSTASQTRILGPFIDDTDGTTAETGLTIANTDIKLSANGGSSSNKNSGGGTHIVNGNYAVTFDATDTATVGELQVSCKMSGALQVVAKFVVLEEAVYDALFGASAAGYVAAGDLPTNFADLAITSSTGKVTVGTNDDKTGYSLTPTTGLGNQTADITGSLSGSVGSVSGAVGSVAGNVDGNVTGSVGSVLGGINTSGGTITTLDDLDTAQDTQHSTTQASVTSLLNNIFWTLAIPSVIKIPSTGTDDYIIEIALYDGAGNPEAPDAAPTMAVTDNDGNSLSARLGSTTGSLQSTGRYRWIYTSSSAHSPAQLLFFITVTEGSTARVVECSATLESATATVSGFSNNAITSAAITDGAFTQGKFASNYYSGVAANVYQYDTANCDGSAANLSLYSLIHSILRSSRTADSLIIYESDGVTVHVTSALTTVTTVAYISTVSTPAT